MQVRQFSIQCRKIGRAQKRSTALQMLSKGHTHVQEAKDPVLGDILVVVAQVAAALQFIIEEKYLAKYRVPALLGVGLEGMWGLALSAIALPILSIVKGPDGVPLDSLITAGREIRDSWQVQVTTAEPVSTDCTVILASYSHTFVYTVCELSHLNVVA